MSTMPTHGLREVALSHDQNYKMEVARVAFMQECPFYAHLAYSLAKYVFTRDVDTAGTDGRHLIFNPDYFSRLKVSEQIAVQAHEMAHFVQRHPQRFKHYRLAGNIKGLPVDFELANRAADYVINADILATIPRASLNPDWLYDPAIKGDELWEDVYERLYHKPPEGQGKGQGQGQGQGQGKGQSPSQGQDKPDNGQGQGAGPPKVYRDSGHHGAIKGQQGDPVAAANQGRFDEVREPPVDPGTQAVDLPDEHEFQEAVSRAAAVAKSMGKLPGSLQRLVDEILDPQVDWRDHIRMLVTGKIGARHETWTRPNRRRLVLNPIVIMPGKRGYGAETVVVGIDSSGSIGGRELAAFLAEVGGILNDVKPRRIVVIGCDAVVTQVDELTTLDDFQGLRERGVKGGGGTSFVPVFDYCEEHQLRPETLVYLTDMLGRFPAAAPGYPVVWAATTDVVAPFGETVRIKL